jgi:hypothetical protein
MTSLYQDHVQSSFPSYVRDDFETRHHTHGTINWRNLNLRRVINELLWNENAIVLNNGRCLRQSYHGFH